MAQGESALWSPFAMALPLLSPVMPARWRLSAAARAAFAVYAAAWAGLVLVVEYPRSIAGVRLALLFRDLGHGKVKVSFRSLAGVNVNTLARRFGGGGHARASGALVSGTLLDVTAQVLGEARHQLEAGALAD